MKKVLVLILALTLALSLVACGGEKDGAADMKVAMITDYGDITDQSFNQTTYEACKAFADSNSVDFKYYKPASDSDADRITMIETAINDGYNVIVMPGYAFANAVKATAGEYSDVTFIALDVGHGDLDTYDEQGNLVEEYKVPSNLYCATYQEELCGYMAGYAAVKLGYKHIGFLGGMRVPAVQRYGYGYVQGADAAAKELGLTDVTLKYLYGGAFGPKPEIKAAMDTWCQGDTEIIFAAGGGIYISAAEAAQSTGKKLIGVDTDQKGIIDGAYGEGITVSSAMKGLAPTVQTLLTAVAEGKFSDYGGKVDTLGLVSATPSENYVQLGTTQWSDGFTEDDYNALVKAMFDGTVKVSNDITVSVSSLATTITVDDQGALA